MCQIDSQGEAAVCHRELSSGLSDDPEGGAGGGKEAQRAGGAHIHTADPLGCTAETNTIILNSSNNIIEMLGGFNYKVLTVPSGPW